MHRLFKAIVTHFRVDLDELTAIYLAVRFGYERFFGKSEDVSIDFVDAGTQTPCGMTAKKWMNQGSLPFGIGGPDGPFDEHQDGLQPRKKGECAATLVAKFLGIFCNPKLKPILDYVLACDYGKRAGRANDFSVLIKTLHWQYPNDPRLVLDWSFAGLDAKYGDIDKPDDFTLEHLYERLVSQGYAGADEWYELAEDAMREQEIHLHTVTADEFSQKSEVFSVAGSGCKNIKIAVVSSDDELICRYVFGKSGGRCDVLVQKKSTGNVQIFSNKHHGIFLDEIVPIIRSLEIRALGIPTHGIHGLGWEGNSPHERSWCFMHRIFMFNGSLTAPNVKPTKLSLEQIVNAVCKGLAKQKAKKDLKKTEKMAA